MTGHIQFQKKVLDQLKLLITDKIGQEFDSGVLDPIHVKKKADQSIITIFDELISNFIRDHKETLFIKSNEDSSLNLGSINFYSEEEHCDLIFPSIILDPIDGTREFSLGIPQSVVSLAYMNSADIDDKNNLAWIYSPLSGMEIFSEQLMLFSIGNHNKNRKIVGLVSFTEMVGHRFDFIFNDEMLRNQFTLVAQGSIAFKLAMLAVGSHDFVLSTKPKHVWDIAAGTILLERRGYYFYSAGIQVKKLDQKIYFPPLVWFHSSQVEFFKSHGNFFTAYSES